MSDHVDLGIALVVGAVAGVAGIVLSNVLVGVNLALVYAVLAWLFVNYRHAVPETSRWRTGRWTGLLTLVVLFGANTTLYADGVAPGLGFALAGLVFGVGYATFLIAVAMLTETEGGGKRETAESSADPDGVNV